MAWRTDYSFPVEESGLKRTIKEYLRENFYGGILAGEFANQEPGAVDASWSLSFNAYQAMVNDNSSIRCRSTRRIRKRSPTSMPSVC
jgi:hypothetical protein